MTESINTQSSNRVVKMLAGLTIVYGIGVVTLVPFAGEGANLSPIPVAWAAPNCDADGDGHDKDNRKCKGDDYDDSDPCVPDDSVPACGSGGGGGEIGSEISMDCMLEGVWGDSSDETIKSDTLGDYEDAVDKVNCSIGGPSTPWPISLGVGIKGRPANSVRKVDVALGHFQIGTFNDAVPGATEGTDYLKDLYPHLFVEAGSLNLDDMEPIRLSVRPYRNNPDHSVDGIHLLPWSPTPYEMGLRFSIPGAKRFSISIASEHYSGNESFTGIGCQTGNEQDILDNAPGGGGMKDVSVYLWPDDNGDGYPDAYTASTGTINVDADGIASVTPGSRWAAVCSSVGPDVCGNPKAPSNCNFLGYVTVQFTMHTVVK